VKNSTIRSLLACPCHRKEELLNDRESLYCERIDCGQRFPIVDHIPILINERTSLFRVQDISGKTAKLSARRGWRDQLRQVGKRLVRYVPTIDANWKAKRNIRRLRQLLLEEHDHSIVLIIGSGEGDKPMEANLDCAEITLVRFDVYFAPEIDMIADSHELPFKDQSFDAIVCQSVLEHVIDPDRCVREIHRTLKADGIVYAEVPFIQQVHAKAYDFTRFTLGGLRRLFRDYEVVDAGVEGGPGMALAWSITWFFRSLSASVGMEAFTYFVLPFFIFWLKYVDYFIVESPQAADAASELYFLGRRSESVTPDRQIVAEYWMNTRNDRSRAR
jgi:SAM-dependent methyltransferase